MEFTKKDGCKNSMQLSCSAIILAAGNGSRLKSSTPKVLQKVGGLALLDHVIRAAKRGGIERIAAVVKPNFSIDQLQYGDGIFAAFQEIQKGTADAVLCGLLSLESLEKTTAAVEDEEWIFVLYADIPLISPETLQNMFQTAHICDKTGVVVLAANFDGIANLGKLKSAEIPGTISAIVEARDVASALSNGEESANDFIPLCNCGLLIKKEILLQFIDSIKPSPVTGETYITEIVRIAHENGHICRYFEGDPLELSGANTFSELAVLERNFQNVMREKMMANGVKMIAPETVFFSYDTKIDSDVIINPYVVFGPGVHVRSGAFVKSFCNIEGANIHAAEIGPFARIRPESEICDGARIGNFVEVKKSLIAEGAKVNHLSYIGDSTIGSRTNIGAGTITCNYDGKNKHKTQIGSEAFIGSNTALVAPLKIADGATIAAGSVITEDVPSDALAVARGRQANVAGWKFKKAQKNPDKK